MERFELIETQVFNGSYWIVSEKISGCEIGRILSVGNGFHARHYAEHEGAFVTSLDEAQRHIAAMEAHQDALFAAPSSRVA